jgi:UDP-glucose 4-epimerase
VPQTVLVTGGRGYIGSHACVALAAAGYRLSIVDNLSSSKPSVLERLRELTGSAIEFHRADLRERAALRTIASGCTIPLHFVARRQGDVAACYADASRAAADIGWKAELDLDAMCRDLWRWQSQNPGGYP